MKRRIYYAAVLTVALPFGMLRAEGEGDLGANTAILPRAMDNGNTQPNPVRLSSSQSKEGVVNKSATKMQAAKNATSVREMQMRQTTIEQLKEKIEQQEIALKTLQAEKSYRQSVLSAEFSRLQQAIKHSQQENMQLQQQLKAQEKEREQQVQQMAEVQPDPSIAEKQNQAQETQPSTTQWQEHLLNANQQPSAPLLPAPIEESKTPSTLNAQVSNLEPSAPLLPAPSEESKTQSTLNAQVSKGEPSAPLSPAPSEESKTPSTLNAQVNEGELNARLQQIQLENAKLQEQVLAQDKCNDLRREQIIQLQEQVLAEGNGNELKRKQIIQLQQQLAEAGKKQNVKPATGIVLETEQQKRNYAIGISLANDIQGLLESKKALGIDVNRQWLLAGVTDAINGHPRLPADQIAKILHESERDLEARQKKIKGENEQKGAKYIAQFRKQAGVVKSKLGFYYRIDYEGDSPIAKGDKLAVVVKESLVDGKVINDMDMTGSMLLQTLNEYPPVFREALGKLKNHGSMTLVVPSALAYGDKGLPPDILPGATMIYNIRILDALPAGR